MCERPGCKAKKVWVVRVGRVVSQGRCLDVTTQLGLDGLVVCRQVVVSSDRDDRFADPCVVNGGVYHLQHHIQVSV